MNDEEYIPNKKENKIPTPTQKKVQSDTIDRSQATGRILSRLAEEFNHTPKAESARERARRASREVLKERNDTSGGGRVSKTVRIFFITAFDYKYIV